MGALRSLQSKQKLTAEQRQEMHLLSNIENKKWIEDFVERETAVARMRVQYSETAIRQELNDITTATGKAETTFAGMLNAIGDSLSDLASSNDKQHRED